VCTLKTIVIFCDYIDLQLLDNYFKNKHGFLSNYVKVAHLCAHKL